MPFDSKSMQQRSKTPITIIYITGCGRSGSTLIDIILGNHPEIESLGELSNLISSGWIKHEYCGCGKRGNNCPFWFDIRMTWNKLTGVKSIKKYLDIQNTYENYLHWPRLLKERLIKSNKFRAYIQYSKSLFEAISAVSGKYFLVDSSKNPGRAFALSMIPGIKLKTIHLVRDGRGVVWSKMKAFEKNEENGLQTKINPAPAWLTSLRWLVVNLASELVSYYLAPNAIRIHYEDFVENPQNVLNKIGHFLQIDLNALADAVASRQPMSIRHTIAGNRMRMGGVIHLKKDYEWQKKLSERDKKIFRLIAGFLAKKYGYYKAKISKIDL